MNNSILIKHSNTSNGIDESFLPANIINFNYNGSDYKNIDEYISKEIINILNDKKFDRIFIKDNLSSNYLELHGLRAAYHIRLSIELSEKRFVPIIILSDLDGYILNRLEPTAKIIFTKNIFLEPNTRVSIEKYNSKKIDHFIEKNFANDFLNHIEVQSPENSYSHSIANEWAIYIWAKFLKLDHEVIQKNKENIASMLYFKYLISKYSLDEVYQDDPRVNLQHSKKGGLKIVSKTQKAEQKILYIDDEWNKGWNIIFETYFSNQSNITFKTVEEINKDTKYDILEGFVKENIQSYKPDLIILDMRLIQEDHHTYIDEKNISGIQILQYIKTNINPGIQVILFTASGKSKILDEAHKYDILGYIKKEHPKDTIINTKETFEKLKALITIGLEKQYLKDIWNIQKEILGLNIFTKKQYNQIKIEIESVFEILNSEMENKFIYAMFAVFKVLEIVVTFYIEEKFVTFYIKEKKETKRFACWKNTDIKIPKVTRENLIIPITLEENNDSTENKIRVVLHEKLSIKEKEIHDNISQITKKRNDAIHRDMPLIDKDNILDWFKLLKTVLSEDNKLISSG